MFRVVLTAAVLAAVAATVPTASAGGGYDSAGGCGFDALPSRATGGSFAGEISDVSVTTTADGRPAYASVTCAIRVNGVVAASGTWSGWGFQAGAKPYAIDLGPLDSVDYCETFVFGHGAATTSQCLWVDPTQIPPQAVVDLVDAVAGPVLATVCATAAAHAGEYGPVTIGSDGDVSANDPAGLLLDCPPAA
jgi:hypothetical protein